MIADANKTLLFLDGQQGSLLFSYPLPLPVTTTLTNATLVSLVYLEKNKASSSSSSLSSSLLLGFDDSTILQIPKVPLSSISSVVKSNNGLKKIESALGALKVNLLYQTPPLDGNNSDKSQSNIKIQKFIFSLQTDTKSPVDNNVDNFSQGNNVDDKDDVLLAMTLDVCSHKPHVIRMYGGGAHTNMKKLISSVPCSDIALINDDYLMLVTQDNKVNVVNISCNDFKEMVSVKLPFSTATSTTSSSILSLQVFPVAHSVNDKGEKTTIIDKENHNPIASDYDVSTHTNVISSIACAFSLLNKDVNSSISKGTSGTNGINSISSFCLLNVDTMEAGVGEDTNLRTICSLLDRYNLSTGCIIHATPLAQYSSTHLLDKSRYLYWDNNFGVTIRTMDSSIAFNLVEALNSGMSCSSLASSINFLTQGSFRYRHLTTLLSNKFSLFPYSSNEHVNYYCICACMFVP